MILKFKLYYYTRINRNGRKAKRIAHILALQEVIKIKESTFRCWDLNDCFKLKQNPDLIQEIHINAGALISSLAYGLRGRDFKTYNKTPWTNRKRPRK